MGEAQPSPKPNKHRQKDNDVFLIILRLRSICNQTTYITFDDLINIHPSTLGNAQKCGVLLVGQLDLDACVSLAAFGRAHLAVFVRALHISLDSFEMLADGLGSFGFSLASSHRFCTSLDGLSALMLHLITV